MAALDRIYLQEPTKWFRTEKTFDNDVEYVRTDAFIEKATAWLNNNLDDVVEIRVPGTIIPHRVLKRDFIDDFAKHMKGE